MAELVDGAILEAIVMLLDRLTLYADQFLNFIQEKNLDQNLLHRLKPTLTAAKAVLNDAELKQIKDSAVKDWLDDLKDAVYEADDLIDEIFIKTATPNQVFNFSSNNLNVHDREMGNKLEAITNRLELIVNQRDVLGLETSVLENLAGKPQSAPLVKVSDVYGREKDKEAIIELLADHTDTLSVIPVVGKGGIGKTTLVQLVYDDDYVKQKFDLRAWACVSQSFDLFKITHTIIKAVSPDYHCNIMDLNLLQLDLKEKLLGKKFLVVLDDVWHDKYDDWDSLMNPFHYGEEGSKILVTTRSERVGSIVKTIPSFYHLGVLLDEDCFAVFVRHAFHSSDSTSNSYLEKIGRDVASKCEGLPLAAKALGGLFRSMPDIQCWNDISMQIDILKIAIWDTIENEIISALRVSYYFLPPHLKKCYDYCSNFPKDYKFEKKELILMWMAKGILRPSKRGMTMEELGSECFDDLTSMSYFRPSSQGDGLFVMHDFIRKLATEPVVQFGSSSNSKVYMGSAFRIEDIKDIMKAMTDANINLIGIWGSDSSYKAYLLEKISRRARRDNMFDVVVMITVTKKPDLKRIQEEISQMLGLNFDKEKDLAKRARSLCDKIKEHQKILIVLQDLLEELDLGKVGIPFGEDHRGCKILLTSPSRRIFSNQIDSQKVFHVI